MMNSHSIDLFSVAANTVRATYQIGGLHRSQLPATTCPHCRATWASSYSYPSLEPTSAVHYPEIAPVPWEEYGMRRDLLRKELGPSVRLQPGTEFGPFIATYLRGRIVDFAQSQGCLFVRRSVYNRILEAGIALPPLVPVLDTNLAPHEDLFELEVPHAVPLELAEVEENGGSICPVCDRLQPSDFCPQIRVRDVPAQSSLFRVHRIRKIYASAVFVETVKSLGLKGLTFDYVDTVP
jgi:hypothetical protein